MPSVIDPETMNVDKLPGVWSPVQWDLSEKERIEELDNQATASLLFSVDTPEAILRLLLDEYQTERALDPPGNYDPEKQGEWNPDLLTFRFSRSIKLVDVKREKDYLYVEYNFEGLGYWAFEIEPESMHVYRL
jgi:hypothetical protein